MKHEHILTWNNGTSSVVGKISWWPPITKIKLNENLTQTFSHMEIFSNENFHTKISQLMVRKFCARDYSVCNMADQADIIADQAGIIADQAGIMSDQAGIMADQNWMCVDSLSTHRPIFIPSSALSIEQLEHAWIMLLEVLVVASWFLSSTGSQHFLNSLANTYLDILVYFLWA